MKLHTHQVKELALKEKGKSFNHCRLCQGPTIWRKELPQPGELQAADDQGQASTYSSSSLYRHAAPAANPSRPAGEWNRSTVRCRALRVEVWSNGGQVMDTRLNGYPTLRQPPLRGYIGLRITAFRPSSGISAASACGRSRWCPRPDPDCARNLIRPANRALLASR